MLFQKGKLVTGKDTTSQISLWDAGVEKNEEPGFGPNQAQLQSEANAGITESESVNMVHDGFTYPVTNKVIKVAISYD